MSQAKTSVEVYGARTHNLKDVSVSIPHHQLVVLTGVSGCGKSSLAFDTVFAEGQRRYIDTFSSYARQYLGGLDRPDVDKIEGLMPVISIEQKTVSRNPRSTVGTTTEISDFLRLLYAKVSTAYSYETGKPMKSYTEDQIIQRITTQFDGKVVSILTPLVKSRKGHYQDLFETIAKRGYLRVVVNGQEREITRGMKLERYKTHDIDLVVDKLQINAADIDKRTKKSILTALKEGKGVLKVREVTQSEDVDHTPRDVYFSQTLMCEETGISYPDPEPNMFSFNSPKGQCTNCQGLGVEQMVSTDLILPNSDLSLKKEGVAGLTTKQRGLYIQCLKALKKFDFNENTPIKEYSKEAKHYLLYGDTKKKRYDDEQVKHLIFDAPPSDNMFAGLAHCIKFYHKYSDAKVIQRWAEDFITPIPCTSCHGHRLHREALSFRIGEHNIGQVSMMSLSQLGSWVGTLPSLLSDNQMMIAKEIIKEIKGRLDFILAVGLGYLALNRPASQLSGGESQRVRLATQIGSELMGVLYILDEPSIGLHQRDNEMLIGSLKKLRDIGNSVLVVEHDKDIMCEADQIIEIGQGAGMMGGRIVAQGQYKDILKADSPTLAYLDGRKRIEIPTIRRPHADTKKLILKGANGNNLKDVDAEFPLGTLICVTGVSGSGKSTLINETLRPILKKHFFRAVEKPLSYASIEGLEHLDKAISVDQSPIGRTPRSNPATYTGFFSDIRSLFARLPEAQIKGYKPGRFSFNVKGGRCETCQGGGKRVIDMGFLPDVYVECETCMGKRFNRETLSVLYKGYSISDVLNLTINQAVEVFEDIPSIYRKLKAIQDVGLGYITIGQPSTTISGGEAQRVKLASELVKRGTDKTFYIFDEPTTGLHFQDIDILMQTLNKLVDRGNTVLIIEHNLDVIKLADYVIDLGPEGGEGGGKIVCTGTPEEVAQCGESHTGRFLKKELGL